MPTYRATPADFCVWELPLYEPSGEGEHTYLWVEKQERTTEEVASQLAALAGVPPREVGYAGRKDRFALTWQWFSVPGLVPEEVIGRALDGATIHDARRHRHKLRTGHLRGNRFRLRVRGLETSDLATLPSRLEQVALLGMPNRFGVQRFGRYGDNASEGARVLRGERRQRDRRAARFLVSATQSAVFNRVLELREERLGTPSRPGLAQRRDLAPRRGIDVLVAGDVATVHDSGGLFIVEHVEEEQLRADRGEISATGPMFGHRLLEAVGQAGELERAALAEWGLDPVPPAPRGIELRGTRRALRVRPQDLAWRFDCDPGASELILELTLAAGSYATVLLEELFGAGRLVDGGRLAVRGRDAGPDAAAERS